MLTAVAHTSNAIAQTYKKAAILTDVGLLLSNN